MVFLRYLDDHTTEEEELEALRSRFEESDEWLRHKQWHDENGGSPRLVVAEEEVAAKRQPERVFVEEERRPVHRVKVGGCECQPRSFFMQLDEKNNVVPGVPQPVEDAKEQYGAAAAGSSGTYGASGGGQNVYNASGDKQDLYR